MKAQLVPSMVMNTMEPSVEMNDVFSGDLDLRWKTFFFCKLVLSEE